MKCRRGVGEVVGSVSMLAVSVALLAGASVIAILSVRQASSLIQGSDRAAGTATGLLLELLTSQSNSSGTYLWLFDYGWTSAPVKEVYLDGRVTGWASSCPLDWSRNICLVTLAPDQRGNVTILVGGVTLAATV